MICPQCQADYRSGLERCPECGFPLVSTLPSNAESHAEPVVIRSYPNEVEANVARTLLEAAGIEFTMSMDPEWALPQSLYPSQGVDVLVRPEDLNAAEEVLAAGESGANEIAEDAVEVTDPETR